MKPHGIIGTIGSSGLYLAGQVFAILADDKTGRALSSLASIAAILVAALTLGNFAWRLFKRSRKP